MFTAWLNKEADRVMKKLTTGEGLKTEEIIILTLKAQTNHIAHLEQDIRTDILAFRQEVDQRFERVEHRFERAERRMDKRFNQLQWFIGGAVALVTIVMTLLQIFG